MGLWSNDIQDGDGFWKHWVIWAYQPEQEADSDPNYEGGITYGVNDNT